MIIEIKQQPSEFLESTLLPQRMDIILFDIDQHGLTIKVRSYQNNQLQKNALVGVIPSLSINPKLEECFENLTELLEFLKDEKNIKVDWEKKIAVIWTHVNVTKMRSILLAEVPLKETTITTKNQLENIIQKCNIEKKKQKQNKLTLDLMIQLTQIVQQLVQKDEEEQRTSQQKIEKGLQKIKQSLELELKSTSFSSTSQRLNRIEQKYKNLIEETKLQLCKKIQTFTENLSVNTQRNNLILFQHFNNLERRVSTVENKSKTTCIEVMSREISQFRNKINADFNAIMERLDKQIIPFEQKFKKYERIITLGSSINKCIHIQDVEIKIQEQPQVHQNIILKQVTEERIVPSETPADLSKTSLTFLDWIDPNCHDFSKIKFYDNQIKGKSNINIFGREVIKKQYSFTVDIISMQKHIGIGIISRNYRNRNLLVEDTKHRIMYWSGGNYRAGTIEQKDGYGFKVNQTVKVIINIQKTQIKWLVNDKVRYLRKQFLLSESVQWVPYIRMVGESALKLNSQ